MKLINRIVVFLLVPCLIGDLAVAGDWRPAGHGPRVTDPVFSSQAVAPSPGYSGSTATQEPSRAAERAAVASQEARSLPPYNISLLDTSKYLDGSPNHEIIFAQWLSRRRKLTEHDLDQLSQVLVIHHFKNTPALNLLITALERDWGSLSVDALFQIRVRLEQAVEEGTLLREQMLALLRPMMTSIRVTDGDRIDSLTVGKPWNATTDQRQRLHWLRLGVKMLQTESGNTLVPFEAVAARLGIRESDLWEFIVETMGLSPVAFSIQEVRRHTWPAPAGEFGNAGAAYVFPNDENHHTRARLKGITRNLEKDILYYGLNATDISWLLKGLRDAAEPKSGKIAFENEAARARYRELVNARTPRNLVRFPGDGEFVIGRMRPGGPFVVRLQAKAFRTWSPNGPRKSHSEYDSPTRRKLARAFNSAVRTLTQPTFIRMPLDFERRDPHVLARARFELRSLHDYYAEALSGEEVVIFHERLLNNLSALTGLMIRELDLLSRPASDSVERLALHLRLWAGATGWKPFIHGLTFLGLADLVQQAFDSVKAKSGERFRSTQPVAGEHTGIRMLLNDKLASDFYTALAQSIQALRHPGDQERSLFPVPLIPLTGAA